MILVIAIIIVTGRVADVADFSVEAGPGSVGAPKRAYAKWLFSQSSSYREGHFR